MVQEESENRLLAMNGITENGSNLLQQSRTTNVLWKRKEQLLRWEDSETNKTSVSPRAREGKTKKKKVKFPEGCVFLAACASGDEDEVETLIERGTDINTSNVDGLTALHQAVIDENLDMVQFLLEQGVEVNAQDNEGWTALHAAVSCGFEDIVRCLLDHSASLAVVNNDGELAVDLAESEEMKSILRQEINKQNLDVDRARLREEEMMLKDATEWLQSRMIKEKRHPKTEATALHVAASKGYLRVIHILLQAGADVNALDKDGWTPLHAAAHWGEREACQVLADHGASFDIINHANQTCLEVADEGVKEDLKEWKEKKRPEPQTIPREHPAPIQRRKNSVTRVSTGDKHVKITKKDEMDEGLRLKSASESEASDTEETDRKRPAAHPVVPSPIKEEIGQGDGQASERGGVSEQIKKPKISGTEGGVETRSPKVPKLEVSSPSPTGGKPSPNVLSLTAKVESPIIKSPKEVLPPSNGESVTNGEVSSRPKGVLGSHLVSPPPVSVSSSDSSISRLRGELPKAPTYQPKAFSVLTSVVSHSTSPQTPSWRLTGRKATNTPPGSPTVHGLQKSGSQPTASIPSTGSPESGGTGDGVKWRSRPFSATESTLGTGGAQSETPGKLGEEMMFRWEKGDIRELMSGGKGKTGVQPSPPILHVAGAGGARPRRALPPHLSSLPSVLSTIREKVSTVQLKSFTPPARKESAEAERKAHSRKQRESRRSTQGITLEQIQDAQQTYMAKETEEKKDTQTPSTSIAGTSPLPTTPPTPTPTPSVPPWRSRALETAPQPKSEDAAATPRSASVPGSTVVPLKPLQQRTGGGGITGLSRARPATVVSHVDTRAKESESTSQQGVTETTSPPSGVPPTRPPVDGSPGKDDSAPLPPGHSKTITTPSAAALRRRTRPNRRSTGPVAQEDIENLDKEEGGADEVVESSAVAVTGKPGESKTAASTARISASLSGYGNKYPSSGVSSERGSSRASSVASLQSTSSLEPEIDYKKLYEKEREENDKLRQKVKELEKQLQTQPLTKINTTVGRDSTNTAPLTDRDRRAFERKISELEEEAKVMEGLRADNQRLKDENGALIRVISKLSK